MPLNEIARTFALKRLPESEVELEGEVPYETLLLYRARGLAHIAEHLELPGFRPGKVPKDMALKKVGEVAVLEEAVEMLVKDLYPALVEAHRIDAVGRPDIRVTKLAPGNPVGLVIRTTVYPEIALPKNWKEVGKNTPQETILPATDEEVQKTLEQLRASRQDPLRRDEHDPNSSAEPAALPELDDAFAKSVGAFETLEQLKAQIKKGIGEEKERASKDARRSNIIDALLEKTDLAVPKIFIESELEKIMAQMREDVQKFGMTFDDYLKRLNKTEARLRDEFRDQARKRAKLQLVLNKIAEEEKTGLDAAVVEQEMTHALEHFPDAKPELVRIHIETVLRNEKVLKLLEEEK